MFGFNCLLENMRAGGGDGGELGGEYLGHPSAKISLTHAKFEKNICILAFLWTEWKGY